MTATEYPAQLAGTHAAIRAVKGTRYTITHGAEHTTVTAGGVMFYGTAADLDDLGACLIAASCERTFTAKRSTADLDRADRGVIA